MKRLLLAIVLFSSATSLFAEEGMFLFTNPPTKAVAEKYGFEIQPDWLERVQKASLRFPGGSGSFVSSSGLILTNHHVAAGQLQMLSTAEKNLLAEGFCAKTPEEELPCKTLELLSLQSIEDVTERVKAVVKPDMSFEAADKARKAVIAQIEKESTDATGLKSDVVTLYLGGQYHLYRYKKYTDIRLVFAPEQQAGAFGGDPDNFEYPRYCLDCTFFRAYEDDKPAQTPLHFGWAKENVKDEQLVFVSGHPARTNRAYDPVHIDFQRVFFLPRIMQRLYRLETIYSVFGERSAENMRRIKGDLDGVKNSRKVRLGQQAGLMDPELALRKNIEFDTFNSAASRDENILKENQSLPNLKMVLDRYAATYSWYTLLEQGTAFPCRTFQMARTIVRLTGEIEKPNDDRLPEYQDANLESVKRSLFSDAPIYEDVEILKLTDGLKSYIEANAGAPNSLLTFAVLNQQSPSRRANELVKETKLFDVEERKRLVEGGRDTVLQSDDPMIKLALAVDDLSRRNRKFYETEVDEPLKQIYAKLAEWKLHLFGDTGYPDATFTLRLSYGTVKGYTEDDGTAVPPWTEIGGLYDRAAKHKNVPPFDVAESWARNKDNLDLTTPFNLVSTNDIIGGNSGSPLFNENAEVVGLIFDGNLQSLSSDMIYSDIQARAVSVHAAAIVEAMKKIYGMDRIVNELGR